MAERMLRMLDDVVALLFVDPEGARVEARWLDALSTPSAHEPASVSEFRHQLETFGTDPSMNPEDLHLQNSFAEATAALDEPGPPFGDRPVVVLSAETNPRPQLGLRRPSSRGRSTRSGPTASRSSQMNRP